MTLGTVCDTRRSVKGFNTVVTYCFAVFVIAAGTTIADIKAVAAGQAVMIKIALGVSEKTAETADATEKVLRYAYALIQGFAIHIIAPATFLTPYLGNVPFTVNPHGAFLCEGKASVTEEYTKHHDKCH